MAGGARGRLHGGGIGGTPRAHAQIVGGRKLGCGGGDGSKNLAAGGPIDRGVVRSRRIGCGGFHINSYDEFYVPDSEEEEADEVYVPDSEEEEVNMAMEDEAAVGTAAVMVPTVRPPAIAVATDVGSAAAVAADGAPAMEVAANGDATVELAPEVQARLQVVLASIDPLYYNTFIRLIVEVWQCFSSINCFRWTISGRRDVKTTVVHQKHGPAAANAPHLLVVC